LTPDRRGMVDLDPRSACGAAARTVPSFVMPGFGPE
jgi:hypothetical protein